MDHVSEVLLIGFQLLNTTLLALLSVKIEHRLTALETHVDRIIGRREDDKKGQL